MVAIFLTLGNAAQVAFTGDVKPEANMPAYQQAHEGASVAMGDTVKVDSLKRAPATANVLK